jgi:hypothetical protein
MGSRQMIFAHFRRVQKSTPRFEATERNLAAARERDSVRITALFDALSLPALRAVLFTNQSQ